MPGEPPQPNPATWDRRRILSVAGLGAALAVLALSWYLTLPSRYIDDACALFARNPDWRRHSQEVERRWGVPVAVQLAIVRQESSFRSDAYPPRTRLLGLIPWERATTAYGYAQALDATWSQYQLATGNPDARRDDFAASIDFVGWYLHQTERRLGIPQGDAYRQYLAYHEGHRGYRERSHHNKPWLLGVAGKVEAYARRYQQQLRECPDD
jgi:hypothetical protein